MRKKIVKSDMPIGKLTRIEDFLPRIKESIRKGLKTPVRSKRDIFKIKPGYVPKLPATKRRRAGKIK